MERFNVIYNNITINVSIIPKLVYKVQSHSYQNPGRIFEELGLRITMIHLRKKIGGVEGVAYRMSSLIKFW